MEKISRHKYEKDFTVVNNEFLRDKTISWKAKGLICYTTMLPENWVLNMTDLKNRSTDGRDSLMSGINELIKAGYCKRNRVRSGDGTIVGVNYEIADFKAFEQETDFPVMDEPQTEKPFTGNPAEENPLLIKTNKKESTKGSKHETQIPELFPELSKDKKTIFRNSLVFDYKVFLLSFKEPEFKEVDLFYYYNSVLNWSDKKDKSVSRTARGWIATARDFMRGDAKDKKLQMIKTENEIESSNQEAVEYLKM